MNYSLFIVVIFMLLAISGVLVTQCTIISNANAGEIMEEVTVIRGSTETYQIGPPKSNLPTKIKKPRRRMKGFARSKK